MNLVPSDKLSLFSAEPTPQPPPFGPGSTAWRIERFYENGMGERIDKVQVVGRLVVGAQWCVRREGEDALWHVDELYPSPAEATRALLIGRDKRIAARLVSLERLVRETHAEHFRLLNERKLILEELAALPAAEEAL